MPSTAHLLRDDRDFVTWRDETAANWERFAAHAEARALISRHPKDHRHRARVLREFAAKLRAEKP